MTTMDTTAIPTRMSQRLAAPATMGKSLVRRSRRSRRGKIAPPELQKPPTQTGPPTTTTPRGRSTLRSRNSK